MMHRLLFTLALLGVGLTAAIADVISPTSISASSDGSSVHVKWVSVDETGVARFEVWRSAGTSQNYQYLGKKVPAGSGTLYDFDDDTAFKLTDNFYSYEIKVVFTNGSSVSYYTSVMTKGVSSVRRTWGSIKAMFR